jgi:hypothetical protein
MSTIGFDSVLIVIVPPIKTGNQSKAYFFLIKFSLTYLFSQMGSDICGCLKDIPEELNIYNA